MNVIIDFLKGIVVGVGGIAPGLSGSVMLIILGLYEKTINAIGTFFKNFKKNVLFLVPLFMGFGVGVLLFSKIVDFMLNNYEFHTRYLFLGLVVGTVPLFYKEVKKNGFSKKFYPVISISALFGFFLFSFNKNLFPIVENPNLIQSVLLGVAVAGSSIIPGVDSAVILSALGLYELYVSSLADFNLSILIPAAFGLGGGALLISYVMNGLIKKFYTVTFSVIFGLFISIIPKVLNESCAYGSIQDVILSVLLVIVGVSISIYFGDIKGNNERIKKLIKKS
ncbi:MAG: DUF368 domain-containing protein [Clostridia bacterium]|nr:DUF368 domain-containing protein [Clostridia bacterium]